MSKKEEKMLRLGGWMNRTAYLLGGLSLVLPVLFWKYIPEEIPMHFGADGVKDRMGEKTELILIFLVILILAGVMAVSVYYVKTNALSRNTDDTERGELTRTYPLLSAVNLAVMGMFAYMMYCCVTGRNLGRLFFPAVLAATFAPVIWYIFVSARERPGRKVVENCRETESSETGVRYRTAVDWWLGLLLCGCLVYMVYLSVTVSVERGRPDWVLIVTTLLSALIILPMFFISYTLYPEYILISSGVFGKERIPYRSITGIKNTRNPVSSAAMSLNRIQIDYMTNGVHRMTLISPVNRKEFTEKVEQYRRQW